jgi:DNA repair protein RadC
MENTESYLNRLELRKLQSEFQETKITSSSSAAQYMRRFYGDDLEIFESSFILLLNNQMLTIGYAKISQGGIVGTVIDSRLIAHYAVQVLATSVIICHNHPSGTLTPSHSDIHITAKIKEGLRLLDIELQDHIILTSHGYYSFADEGKL